MILRLCATRRRALEEQTTFFAHYYIQYVSDRLNSSSNPEGTVRQNDLEAGRAVS